MKSKITNAVYTYASLLYHVIEDKQRDEFFSRGPGEWSAEDMRVYLMIYPEEQTWLEGILKNHLDEVLEDLIYYKHLRYAKDDREELMVKLNRSVRKIDW